ncbi:Hypothetical protein SSO11571 [Saccharolobus solfataricus P2]|uniref:Uncharacterized protein n=2 Tax=Saccharolobus solfataricus TaxID=2287 RepID=Q97UP2_SACS2|nr:Hypothetical protein SSO11571 [Saccharolobus solfataricus P2]SAI86615.1 uncharacterised protein [Saccharolobus solfataricus]
MSLYQGHGNYYFSEVFTTVIIFSLGNTRKPLSWRKYLNSLDPPMKRYESTDNSAGKQG